MMLGEFLKYLFIIIILTNPTHGNRRQADDTTFSYPSTKHTEFDNTKSNETTLVVLNNKDFQDRTHQSRESVTSELTPSLLNNNLTEIVVPKKNDGKVSVPKKGVEHTPGMKPTDNLINVGPITVPTPNYTEANQSNSEQLHKINQKNSKTYVILVVAVVFVMPLLAFLIMSLYKKGSEWWEHRHYRRMDFLIEGMYNN